MHTSQNKIIARQSSLVKGVFVNIYIVIVTKHFAKVIKFDIINKNTWEIKYMANKAVALVGMCGSGKSVLTEFFTQLGWEKVYFGGVTVAQLKKQGLEINEANERAMREGLRKQYGMGAFAFLLLDEITEKLEKTNTVLDGLYSWSEYKILREKFGEDLVVLAITTNSSVRYQRLAEREFRPLTAEQARSRDISEIENLEKGGPISIADYYIDNNGSVEALKAQFEKFIEWLNK